MHFLCCGFQTYVNIGYLATSFYLVDVEVVPYLAILGNHCTDGDPIYMEHIFQLCCFVSNTLKFWQIYSVKYYNDPWLWKYKVWFFYFLQTSEVTHCHKFFHESLCIQNMYPYASIFEFKCIGKFFGYIFVFKLSTGFVFVLGALSSRLFQIFMYYLMFYFRWKSQLYTFVCFFGKYILY